MSPVVTGANKSYLTPVTTVEASFEVHVRFPLKNLIDYKSNTYSRSVEMVEEGDFLIYRFEEPLDCEKITIITGMPGIPIYYVEDGEVAYSLDGELFMNAGRLQYGELTFTPPKGLRAIKLKMGKENYAVYVAFTNLLIE
jgi:hypothetical protein